MGFFETYLGLSASKICPAMHDMFCFLVLNTLSQLHCALTYLMEQERARDLPGQMSCTPAAGKSLFQDNGRELLLLLFFPQIKDVL